MGTLFYTAEVSPCGASRAPSSLISGYDELPFEVSGIKKDLKVVAMPELDADCYLGVNFIRKFQAVLDPCSNQLLIKSAGRLLELELTSVAELGVMVLSALGLVDVTEKDRQRLQEFLDSKTRSRASKGRLHRLDRAREQCMRCSADQAALLSVFPQGRGGPLQSGKRNALERSHRALF